MAKSAAIKEEKIKERVKAQKDKEAKVKEGKTKAKSKSQFEKNEVGIRKGTVLESIFNVLKKGGTISQILEQCKKDHPDRDPEAMQKTIRLQLFRMPKEKGFKLEKDKGKGGEMVYKVGEIDPSLIEKPSKKDKEEKAEKKKDKKVKKAKAEEEDEEEEVEDEEEETEEEEDEDEED